MRRGPDLTTPTTSCRTKTGASSGAARFRRVDQPHRHEGGNTLDTIVTEGGRGVVRHYLQDVGSTFGVGASGPHEWNEGWECIYDGAGTKRRLFTFGLAVSPWQTADYEKHPSIGRFEGEAFDPETWKPRVPTAAYIEMRADDAFWAARRVMAFSDDLIRAIVKTGGCTDPAAEKYLGDVLIQRRDKIGRAYLAKINPVVDPTLDASGVLSFGNAAAVQYGVTSAPRGYAAAWHTFDNATAETRPLGQTTGAQSPMTAPAGLPAAMGAYIRVDIAPIIRIIRLEGASASVFSTSGGRLEAGRTGATARLAASAPKKAGLTLRGMMTRRTLMESGAALPARQSRGAQPQQPQQAGIPARPPEGIARQLGGNGCRSGVRPGERSASTAIRA